MWAMQEGNRDLIIFNNGLHGWHIKEQEYSKLYDEFLNKLINEFPNTLIMPVLTTFVTNPDYHNDRVIERNTIVNELAMAKNLSVIDLYAVSVKNKSLQSEDGVHFTGSGYIALAHELLERIKMNI